MAEPGTVVLLIEDEIPMRRFLRAALDAREYQLIEAGTARDGLAQAASRNPDLILLDLGLPDGDGIEVTRRLREWTTRPIIVLSARGQDADKIAALDAGADDYLTKPFAFAELLARVRAHLRRRADARAPILRVADLILDPATRTVKRGDEPVTLTNREFALLEYFLRNPGRVLTRTMIAEHVWDYSFDSSTNVIDVYVNYLRKKIDAGRETKLLHTVRGVGYVLKAE